LQFVFRDPGHAGGGGPGSRDPHRVRGPAAGPPTRIVRPPMRPAAGLRGYGGLSRPNRRDRPAATTMPASARI